jgi:BolA family transcriptional regulator, general stress-responsive regulator
MNRSKRIQEILEKHISNLDIQIVDNSYLHKGHNNFNGQGETHITINLQFNSDSKINRLEIHRKINSLLKKEFDTGLHSLEIKIN